MDDFEVFDTMISEIVKDIKDGKGELSTERRLFWVAMLQRKASEDARKVEGDLAAKYTKMILNSYKEERRELYGRVN